jgi:hypothetical protein
MAVSFIGEENRSTQIKPPTCRKSLKNLTCGRSVVSTTKIGLISYISTKLTWKPEHLFGKI